MYESAKQEDGGSQEPPEPTGESKKGDDKEIEDADFEVVDD